MFWFIALTEIEFWLYWWFPWTRNVAFWWKSDYTDISEELFIFHIDWEFLSELSSYCAKNQYNLVRGDDKGFLRALFLIYFLLLRESMFFLVGIGWEFSYLLNGFSYWLRYALRCQHLFSGQLSTRNPLNSFSLVSTSCRARRMGMLLCWRCWLSCQKRLSRIRMVIGTLMQQADASLLERFQENLIDIWT